MWGPNPPCCFCKLPIVGAIHWNHLRPFIEGGSDRPDNLAPSHPYCNLADGAAIAKRRRRSRRMNGYPAENRSIEPQYPPFRIL
jgi:hypothetical protein